MIGEEEAALGAGAMKGKELPEMCGSHRSKPTPQAGAVLR